MQLFSGIIGQMNANKGILSKKTPGSFMGGTLVNLEEHIH